jgi:DNA-binding MurR/RpiR family transcriptional regulator
MEKPSTVDGLRKLISREGERLTPRTRDAARYAIDHPNDLALNPIARVAALSGIPPAAFVRMAQALGFDGYADLQRLFREPLQHASQPTFRERIRHYGGELTLENPGDPAEVLRVFSQANMLSLEHLQANASVLPLKAAIKLIKQARMVHVLGLRRSFAVAAYLAYALNRVGRPTALLTGLGGTISEQASMVGPQDLLIAISFPPYAADTVKACEQIRKGGAKRLSITNACMSPIATDADLVLEVNDAELRGFRSLTSAMCLAQTLAMNLAFMKPRVSPDDDSLNSELSDIDC